MNQSGRNDTPTIHADLPSVRARLQPLKTHLATISSPGHSYPWNGLEQQMKDDATSRLRLVGYGSLLNPLSAARTISNTPPEGHPPVLAMGALRVFNYRMPQSAIDRYGVAAGPSERAALNTEPTGSVEHILNGRLLEVKAEDIPALREREKQYDLRPVACVWWHGINTVPFTAYVLCCPPGGKNGEAYVDDTLKPYRPYYELCRDGAALVSDEFLETFKCTTFLADRATDMRVWERSC